MIIAKMLGALRMRGVFPRANSISDRDGNTYPGSGSSTQQCGGAAPSMVATHGPSSRSISQRTAPVSRIQVSSTLEKCNVGSETTSVSKVEGRVFPLVQKIFTMSCEHSYFQILHTSGKSSIQYMIRWMYSGINVHGFSTIGTTGGNFWIVGGISCLHSIGCHNNAASWSDCSLTMIIAPNFIKNCSVVAENHHFYDRRRFAPGPAPVLEETTTRVRI